MENNYKKYGEQETFLGRENGEILRFTLVWVFGIQFALRTEQEHRTLRLKNSQLRLEHD